MSVPYETPEEHLTRLLGRALNSFELPDETISSLDSALAHDSSLHAAHHTTGLHRETHRHTYLLADGSALTLWELSYGATQGGPTDHELYTDTAQAELAASRLTPSRAAQLQPRAGQPHPDGTPHHTTCAAAHDTYGDTGPRPRGATDPGESQEAAHAHRAPTSQDPGTAGKAPLTSDAGAAQLADTTRLGLVDPPDRTWPAPAYSPDDTIDHARRLLRRAENRNAPREQTAELLRTALAHQITQSFGHPCGLGTTGPGCALYEHTFLLSDGNRLSLWELEHTATPDGHHMSEVYENEETARGAMEERAGAGG